MSYKQLKARKAKYGHQFTLSTDPQVLFGLSKVLVGVVDKYPANVYAETTCNFGTFTVKIYTNSAHVQAELNYLIKAYFPEYFEES